jgi:hypothetical protein
MCANYGGESFNNVVFTSESWRPDNCIKLINLSTKNIRKQPGDYIFTFTVSCDMFLEMGNNI